MNHCVRRKDLWIKKAVCVPILKTMRIYDNSILVNQISTHRSGNFTKLCKQLKFW
jgi:hypothetical protein